MANKSIFQSSTGPLVDTANAAGGSAYSMQDKHALAQLAVTGALTDTFYASAQNQLDTVLKVAQKLAKTDPLFVAQTAIYARNRGFMKDMPALLLAVLAAEKTETSRAILKKAFPVIIDNGKMLRNFVQIIRSGQVGRKSFGTFVKRLIQDWLNKRSAVALFKDSIGNDPSLADIIKMVHPKPDSHERASLYTYLLGNDLDTSENTEGKFSVSVKNLPPIIREYEAWKTNRNTELPSVPFQMLTAQQLTTTQWEQIAENASWQTLRMNLNTFERHGVFDNKKLVAKLAQKLRDPSEIKKAHVFPYQLMNAFKNANKLPSILQEALIEAMEMSIDNIPTFNGDIVICPDVSGSMSSPITGSRGSATTSVRCIDVASLFTAALWRKNEHATIIPFETNIIKGSNIGLKKDNSIIKNTEILSSIGGGGTNCAAPLAFLNAAQKAVDLVIFISDNESWMQNNGLRSSTEMQKQWLLLKRNNPKAKLICIDLQPNTTTQVVNDTSVLNIGGFSDTVFDICSLFLMGKKDINLWTSEIEAITF